MSTEDFKVIHENTTFQEWMNACPVQYDNLSHDSEGQIAYVFHTKDYDIEHYTKAGLTDD